MTLLVVLGVVVIATILAALYLSLKSGRGDEPAPGDPGAGGPQARGGSRMGRSPSLAGRVRSMADRGRAAGSSRGRMADDDDDYDVPDYVAARRSSRSAGGADRSSLVAAGAGRQAGGRSPGRFDDTDPALQAGYGQSGAGYDGYDAAADTRVSGPLDAEPGTGPFGTAGYDTGGFETGTGPLSSGYKAEPSGGYRGRDAGPARGRGPAREAAYEGSGASGAYPEQDGYAPAEGYSPGASRAPGRAGGRRRATGPVPGPASPGRPMVPGDPPAPGGAAALGRAAGYDDAPTAFTDSPFSPSGPEPGLADPDAQDTGERHTHGGRRRIAKIQKPQLRLSRSRPDYDNDPWPSADEVDGVPDDQYWSDLSSDKPLATTARAAQNASDDESWPPAPGRPAAGAGGPAAFPAPVEADAPTRGRGRRARERDEGEQDSTEPRPLQQPGGTSGRRRRGEPERAPRSAEEDPLTSASFSRHAREANDSRSYRSARQAQHRPSHGRPDSAAPDTQAMPPGARGYGAAGPAGPPEAQAPGRGSRSLPPGSGLPGGAASVRRRPAARRAPLRRPLGATRRLRPVWPAGSLR